MGNIYVCGGFCRCNCGWKWMSVDECKSAVRSDWTTIQTLWFAWIVWICVCWQTNTLIGCSGIDQNNWVNYFNFGHHNETFYLTCIPSAVINEINIFSYLLWLSASSDKKKEIRHTALVQSVQWGMKGQSVIRKQNNILISHSEQDLLFRLLDLLWPYVVVGYPYVPRKEDWWRHNSILIDSFPICSFSWLTT